ncbi:hypothetical protein PENTCL1PPCAC_22134, partial [Pristionchus entomophagus]
FFAFRAQDLDAVIMLLSHGVDVNSQDGNNLTALHYAITNEYILMVKTLLLFGADHEMVRIKGNAVKELCYRSLSFSAPSENKISGKMWSVLRIAAVPSTNPHIYNIKYGKKLLKFKGNYKRTHLLSLDGGGIRGLVLTTILDEIEREIPDFFKRIKWTA